MRMISTSLKHLNAGSFLGNSFNYSLHRIIVKRLATTLKSPGVWTFEPDLVPDPDFTESHYERPTPIILVCGECLPPDIWFSTAKYYYQRGFSGLILSLPEDSEMPNIDTAVDYLERKRHEFGLTPPVMVAHSVSSFLAQKYLESYSLRGLVIVNPIPPYHVEVVKNLIQRNKDCEKLVDIKSDVNITLEYYNFKQEIEDFTPLPFPSNFMSNIVTDIGAPLRLEKGVVPLLIVSTTGDVSITVRASDDNTENPNFIPILSPKDLLSTGESHGVDEDRIIVLKTDSRVPMMSSDTQLEFNQITYSWIDDL